MDDGLKGGRGSVGVTHAEISAALDEIWSFLEPLHMQSRIAGFPRFPLLEKLSYTLLSTGRVQVFSTLIPVRLLAVIHLSSGCEVIVW